MMPPKYILCVHLLLYVATANAQTKCCQGYTTANAGTFNLSVPNASCDSASTWTNTNPNSTCLAGMCVRVFCTTYDDKKTPYVCNETRCQQRSYNTTFQSYVWQQCGGDPLLDAKNTLANAHLAKCSTTQSSALPPTAEVDDPPQYMLYEDSAYAPDALVDLRDIRRHTRTDQTVFTASNQYDLAHYYKPEKLCGNGILDQGEKCDDGNNRELDGCSADCKEKDSSAPPCEVQFIAPGFDPGETETILHEDDGGPWILVARNGLYELPPSPSGMRVRSANVTKSFATKGAFRENRTHVWLFESANATIWVSNLQTGTLTRWMQVPNMTSGTPNRGCFAQAQTSRYFDTGYFAPGRSTHFITADAYKIVHLNLQQRSVLENMSWPAPPQPPFLDCGFDDADSDGFITGTILTHTSTVSLYRQGSSQVANGMNRIFVISEMAIYHQSYANPLYQQTSPRATQLAWLGISISAIGTRVLSDNELYVSGGRESISLPGVAGPFSNRIGFDVRTEYCSSADPLCVYDLPLGYDLLSPDPYADVPSSPPTLLDAMADVLKTKTNQQVFVPPRQALNVSRWTQLGPVHAQILDVFWNRVSPLQPQDMWLQRGSLWARRGNKLFVMPTTGMQVKLEDSGTCAPVAVRVCPPCSWAAHNNPGNCTPCSRAPHVNDSSLENQTAFSIQCGPCNNRRRRLLSNPPPPHTPNAVQFTVALHPNKPEVCRAALNKTGWQFNCTPGRARTQCTVTLFTHHDPANELSLANAWLLRQAPPALCERTTRPSFVHVHPGNDTQPNQEDKQDSTTWIIVGAVVGGVAVVAAVAVAVSYSGVASGYSMVSQITPQDTSYVIKHRIN